MGLDNNEDLIYQLDLCAKELCQLCAKWQSKLCPIPTDKVTPSGEDWGGVEHEDSDGDLIESLEELAFSDQYCGQMLEMCFHIIVTLQPIGTDHLALHLTSVPEVCHLDKLVYCTFCLLLGVWLILYIFQGKAICVVVSLGPSEREDWNCV